MKDLKSIHVSEYINILWRWRWYALAGFLLVSGGAALYSRLITDTYKSDSTIVVEPAVIPQDYVRPSDPSTVDEQIAAMRQLLVSRSFLEKVIQDYQLLGYGTDKNFSMNRAVGSIISGIQISGVSRNTFRISYEAGNPQIAQTITKSTVKSLIDTSKDLSKGKAVETDQFLDNQLRQTEQDLSAQEERIKKFKLEHLGELPEQTGANMNALTGLTTQLASVENAIQQARDQQKLLELRTQEQKRLDVLTRSLSVPSVSHPSPASKDAKTAAVNPLLTAKLEELRTLTSKYTPNHPDVIRVSREVEELKRRLETNSAPSQSVTAEDTSNSNADQPSEALTETDTMLKIEAAQLRVQAETINNEISKREKEKDEILRRMKTYQGRLNQVPVLEQEFMNLSRDYDTLKQQYKDLQSKKFQSQLTTNLEGDTEKDKYRVIDEANLPWKPVFPDRMQVVMIGLVAGIAVGVGAAFGRELLDTTLSSEEDVTAILRLPTLATICEVSNENRRSLIGLTRKVKSA
jgi:succinoglycan biosynthesis transport protein ExoP